MTATPTGGSRRRPWHLWVVAIVIFALYLGGLRDYLLILIQDTDYIVEQFGPPGLDYFADYPVVLRTIWTANILGGLAVPLLLLLRMRWCVPVAIVAAVAQVLLLAVTFALLDRWAALGAATAWFDVGIGVVTALLAGYCWWLRRRGLVN